ncbi:hypothetical protein E8E11_000257 [Didymella keratinophila]|nr:hypothetical protein E8E11_000257 [Didymella keratinophila]
MDVVTNWWSGVDPVAITGYQKHNSVSQVRLPRPQRICDTIFGCFGLEAPLKELGLPLNPGEDPKQSIKIVYLNHFDIDGAPLDQQTYDVGGKTHGATGGLYKFGIETSTGAMSSLLLRSPAGAAKDLKPQVLKKDLPELQRASDLAWLSWAHFAEPKNHLKYFFNVAIANEDTQKAIRTVLKNTDTAYGPWPGVIFSTDTDEGKVLLGTPNGRRHGYFLAQHKAALGNNMYISKIQVFHGATAPFIPNIVLHVEQEQPPTKRRALRKDRAKL